MDLPEFLDANAWLSPPVTATPSGPVTHPTLPKDGLTVWTTIKDSPNFSNFTKLLGLFPDLVTILNGEEECTLFVIPNSVLNTSHSSWKEALLLNLEPEKLHNILEMHISNFFAPSTFLTTAPNVPVLFSPPTLNGAMVINSKRLSDGHFLLNYTVHTTEVDLLCRNGGIHVLDGILLPPPSSLEIISLLPAAEYSIFQKALNISGLGKEVQAAGQKGGVIFIPTNTGFQSLGKESNDFLFSGASEGTACLKILLKQHIVLNETFYSNIHYKNPSLSYDYEHKKLEGEEEKRHAMRHISGVRRRSVTNLLGRLVHFDLRRDGGVIDIKVNGRPLLVRDGNVRDGVVHVVDGVLVPPCRDAVEDEADWGRREWDFEGLRKRLVGWL